MKEKEARAHHHTGPVFAVAYGLRELDKHGKTILFKSCLKPTPACVS